jgi:hypothetical protein
MLFGLSRTEFNGFDAHPLGESVDGRIPVAVMAKGRRVHIKVKPENLGRRADDALSASVIGDPDLASAVAMQLALEVAAGLTAMSEDMAVVDAGLSMLSRAGTVCKVMEQAVSADCVWKKLCAARWRQKWGFKQRWERANDTTPSGGWRARFRHEEEDAVRTWISGEELRGLSCDFRFWLGRISAEPDGDLIGTGLNRSLSRCVRFDPTEKPTYAYTPFEEEDPQGELRGHPNGDVPSIRWFLGEGGTALKWGYLPDLWPKGQVRRLDTWGWEFRNSNVVMRAVDVGNELFDPSLLGDGLFADLIRTMETRPLCYAGQHGPQTSRATAPATFWAYLKALQDGTIPREPYGPHHSVWMP